MSSRTLDGRRRGLASLAAVTAAALIFAVLLVLVRLRWAPLESADHGAAAGINGLIAGNATLVAVVKAVTWLGSDGVLWTVVGAAVVVLALRRQWRLAIYLLVTGAGALILDPVLKSLVGLIEARHGSIRLGGEDVTRMRSSDRMRLGMTYMSELAVFPDLSIEENIRVGAQALGPT
jgi:hypothetical protein